MAGGQDPGRSAEADLGLRTGEHDSAASLAGGPLSARPETVVGHPVRGAPEQRLLISAGPGTETRNAMTIAPQVSGIDGGESACRPGLVPGRPCPERMHQALCCCTKINEVGLVFETGL